MDRRAVNPPGPGCSLTLPLTMWARLTRHLFTDGDEHGAVILVDRADGPRGPRLLGRELLLAADGRDYLPGSIGYRALSASFVRDAAVRARDHQLGYLAVHNHADPPGPATVGFSRTDRASHRRGYPALRAITQQIVGALVLTPRAAAGELWLPDGERVELAELVVPGNNLLRLRPRPALPEPVAEPHTHPDGQVAARPDGEPDAEPDGVHRGWDRQVLLFGTQGQRNLNLLRVAVVGTGGAGSVLVELLARLGVGHLLLIDHDTVEDTNLSRLIAAEPTDPGTPKTELAARNARRANPNITVETITERVEHPTARAALTRCDWIFLAADSDAARHTVNEIVHHHLIPGTQVGVKIAVDPDGAVGTIHTATRPLTPGAGCLWCNGLIDPTELAVELQPDTERAAARYLPEIPAPSVIALNTIAAAEAVNQFMLAAANLHTHDDDPSAVIHLPRDRDRHLQDPRQAAECISCGGRRPS